MTTAIYYNRDTGWNSCPTNASYVGARLPLADADGEGITTPAGTADIDVEIAVHDGKTGATAQRDVVAARCVSLQRSCPDRRVVVTSCIISCRRAVRGVGTASPVQAQSQKANGHIITAGRIQAHRMNANGNVKKSGPILE